MRTVAEELVVCGISSDVPEPLSVILADLDYASRTGHTTPTSTFRLGLLADESIALRREDSTLEIPDPPEHGIHPHSTGQARRHALDESTEETVKGLLGVPTDTRAPHGPSHQPPLQKLLKTIPSSIRSRASSLDEPRPLPFRWQFPVGKRYRIGDADAFAAMKEQNVEWYVTTGVLVEDCMGLRWNAGTYNYLLYWHVEGMPTPDGVETEGKGLSIDSEFMRSWQKGKWEAEFGDTVMDLDDEPATPIVEDPDALNRPMPPLNKASSFPMKSALRSQSRPASPSPSTISDPGSPKRQKKVKFHRKKGKRMVLLEVNDEGVPLEEQGKVVVTSVDEMGVLSDNEGRTTRKRLDAN